MLSSCVRLSVCPVRLSQEVNYLFENERLLKVTGSHIHCKCGNISETIPDAVVTTDLK